MPQSVQVWNTHVSMILLDLATRHERLALIYYSSVSLCFFSLLFEHTVIQKFIRICNCFLKKSLVLTKAAFIW